MEEKILLLMKHGADVTRVDNFLRTALHTAVQSLNHVFVSTLLTAMDTGMQQQQLSQSDIRFETPFMSAFDLPLGVNSKRIIDNLLAAGSDADGQSPECNEAGMGKIMMRTGNICFSVRLACTSAEIRIPVSNIYDFVCEEKSHLPDVFSQHRDAFFSTFFEDINGAVFTTPTDRSGWEFVIFFKDNEGKFQALRQSSGPFWLTFKIPDESAVLQPINARNRGYTAAHSIVHKSVMHNAEFLPAVRHAMQKLLILNSLCNPLVTCSSGKTVADMWAEHMKELGAEWHEGLSDIEVPRLYTTNLDLMVKVQLANSMLRQAASARDVLALSLHKRVGENSGLMIMGPEMLQIIFRVGKLGHTPLITEN